MSTPPIAQLFAQKAAKHTAELGNPQGPVEFDGEKNQHFQLFEQGVILDQGKPPKRESDLICTYGKLFHAWWRKPNAAWLGNPLEDLFETKNREGIEIFVQRFEEGVINCRKDGLNDVQWLSWRDWHAISYPGDDKDKAPTKAL